MNSSVQDLELVLILLLVFVTGFGVLATRLKTPYPILLVIGGLVLSLIPGVPRINLRPDWVFLGVLPPLLYAAAFLTSWRDFRYNLVSICFLAFGLVGFTVFGVAFVAQWILPEFDWRLGLVLGAVVATTDAIAATSIAKTLRLPRRIVDVLEGESLLNDASGLLALEFAVGLVVTGKTPTFSEEIVRLLYLVGSGIGIGLLLGKLVVWLEKHVDDAPIEIILSVVTPYAAYLAAEHIHASGVLSTVACGLFVGRRSATFFSSGVRIEAFAFWNTLIFALNGLVFILIGFQLPQIREDIVGYSFRELVVQGALFSALVIALRLIWMWPGAFMAYVVRRKILRQRENMPPGRWIFVVGWTGMRGVVALAAAISLPVTLPQRNMILFLTFCVIFVTLVLQGLTLPAVIRKLKLSRPASVERAEELKARRWMIQSALRELEAAEDRRDPNAVAIYDDLARHYLLRLAALERFDGTGRLLSRQHDLHEDLSRRFRMTERAAAVALRDGNEISDETLRELLKELDLQDARTGLEYSEDDD